MPSNIYAPVELKLNNLIVLGQGSLTEEELAWVREYNENREYGLVLLTFVEAFIDGNRSYPAECLPIAEELAAMMKITHEIDFETLRRLAR
jgi:hypothetical protein